MNSNFKLQITNFKSGFTVIEFLIVIGLIGIMTTVSIASYNTFAESVKLKNEVQKFIAIVSLAQKKAVSGENVSSYCANCSFNSYAVSTTAGAGYAMQGQYSLDITPNTRVAYGTANTYAIDSSNKNISLLDSYTIYFDKLTGTPDSSRNVGFKNITKNECMQVSIAATGLISSSSIACP